MGHHCEKHDGKCGEEHSGKYCGRHRHGGFHCRAALFVVGGIFVFTFVTMLLWNAVVPGIFGLPRIGFLKALGLLLLSRILFGGLGGLHRAFHMRHRHGGMMRKWRNMSDEDRENFRASHGHHGHMFQGMKEAWMGMSEEARLQFREKTHRSGHGGCYEPGQEPKKPSTAPSGENHE